MKATLNDWKTVARELCDGLDKDIDDVAIRLQKWSVRHRMCLEDTWYLCDIVSSFMFDQIYCNI